MAAKRKSRTPSSDGAAKKPKEENHVVEETFPKEENDEDSEARFLGNPVMDSEAKQRWPHRYEPKRKSEQGGSKYNDDEENVVLARKHYKQAEVDGIAYNLYDDAHVKAEEGEENYICKIIEFFEGVDGQFYFYAQWFYRAVDTVIKNRSSIDGKRVFYSEVRDVNPLDCLVSKLNIVKVALNEDLNAYKASIPTCDYYYDMHYLLPYSTFVRAPSENGTPCSSENSSTISTDVETNSDKAEVSLLDLYAGCGAMSTGLCLGAQLSNCNLVTKWAVDINKYACESLKLNHPETQVRNEAAEDFLKLLKEWEKLCIRFSLISSGDPEKNQKYPFDNEDEEDDEEDNEEEDDAEEDQENFEVEKILQICYGDPRESNKPGLYFKVSWKNYGEECDTWEPIDGLGNCRDAIKDFVTRGYQSKILPLPDGVDVVCGGPPCQGVSGFNRFRDTENPLRDEKNKQLTVYMDIIKFLKPKYVLMENVVDILKFSEGFLGRHAIGRLIEMNYQTRMGMCAAGAYGLPQFRMRVFLFGANPSKKLPQLPLPTHDVIVRGVVPLEFEKNLVAYNEGSTVELEKKLFLGDAISDLPAVANDEQRDEMKYDKEPETEFQRMIRLSRDGSTSTPKLYDHRPYVMNTDDHQRSCQIPKRKGACFRDLPGVRVRQDGKVEWDPDVKRVYLPSKKPLVPDYAMSFVKGTSSKPFARLWWDETVPTVVTRPEPHNQAILHPVQDRVLTIRENARLQGFPDYYKLVGPVKERYIQVGNAVAVPVARALGYALGLAFQGCAADEPVFSLPNNFPNIQEANSLASSEEDVAN